MARPLPFTPRANYFSPPNQQLAVNARQIAPARAITCGQEECAQRTSMVIFNNAAFVREGRCLLFADFSQSLRDCLGCRTIAWCRYYDRAGVREAERLALTRWEDDGGPPETNPPPASLQ